MSSGTGKQDTRSRLSSLVQQRLQATRERVEQRVAGAINSALRATGLGVSVQAPSTAEKAPATPPAAAAPAPIPTAARAPRPFQPAPEPQAQSPEPAPAPVQSGAPPPAPRAAATPPIPTRVSAPPVAFIPQPQGPTPAQVMTAVQNAFGGAVKVISGTIDGVGAAMNAGRAVGKTATGAASVATGVATVASGFFPRLAALGIGVKKAPKNRPGMPPRRRVADIIANPIGRTKPEPAAGSAESGQEPPRPVRRVQRLPMVRPKSSLEMSRKEKSAKPRSYADLQMKPQIGLTPHEILLKVATIALGKTLIGFLEAGARAQQRALQSANDRLSQKQIMLLGMLPAQYIVKRLPQVQAQAQPQQAGAPAESAAGAAGQGTAAGPGPGPGFKIRY